MKKVTENEFTEAVAKAVLCIEIVQCTKTRKCKWEGLESQYLERRVSSIEGKMVCPRCANDEFYVRYEPIDAFKRKFLSKQ